MNNKRMRKAISFLITFCMVFASAATSFAATTGAIAAGSRMYKGYPVVEKQLQRANAWDDTIVEPMKYYYSDGLFEGATNVYDASLSSFGLEICMSFMTETDDAVKTTLADLGCTDIKVRTMNNAAKESGVAMGRLSIKDGSETIVPVIIRSGFYKNEWAEDFRAGESGDASGYSEYVGSIVNVIEGYVDKAAANTKMLLVGYSRGGALAGLVNAKLIADGYSADRIYCYQYDAPRVAVTTGKCGNAFTVRNKDDLIARLFPTFMNMHRTSADVNEVLLDTNTSATLEQLRKITDTEKFVKPDEFKIVSNVDTSIVNTIINTGKIPEIKPEDIISFDNSVSKEQYLNLIDDRAKSVIGSRSNYLSKSEHMAKYAEAIGASTYYCYEEALGTVMNIIENFELKDSEKFKENLTDFMSPETLMDDIKSIGTPVLYIISGRSDAVYKIGHPEKIAAFLWEKLQSEAFKSIFTDDQLAEMKKCIPALTDIAIEVLIRDFSTKEHVLFSALNMKVADIETKNMDSIIQAHYPEMNLAALRADDTLYMKCKKHAKVVKVAAVPATCQKTGVKAHYECPACGAMFTDKAGKKETTIDKLTTPIVNHAYTKKIVDDEHLVAPADCTTAAKYCYVCSMCGLKSESKAFTSGSALGHDWDTENCTVVKAATLSKNGTAAYSCKREGCTATKKTTVYKASRISLGTKSFTYNGNEQKPAVTVKDYKKKVIPETDYDLKWPEDSKYPGTKTVVVQLKNRYTGSKSLNYKITMAKPVLGKSTGISQGLNVVWKKPAGAYDGYEIKYTTSSKMKNAVIADVTDSSLTSFELQNLLAKKKYYFQIRTYITVGGEKTYFSDWSAKKYATTKA